MAATDTETTETHPPAADAGSTAPLAWAVTLTIAALLVLIVVIAAFSQDNTPASVDGRTATTSQFVD